MKQDVYQQTSGPFLSLATNWTLGMNNWQLERRAMGKAIEMAIIMLIAIVITRASSKLLL